MACYRHTMKDALDTLVHADQARFLESLLPARDPLLVRMEEESRTLGIPSADPEVGRFLTLIARSTRPRRIVEVGCAIGYGLVCLSRGAPGARLWSVDRDPDRLDRARRFLVEDGVGPDLVELVQGEAAEELGRLEPGIDLAWIDADKEGYPRYLELLVERLAPGGVLLADNVLWKGRVARGDRDPETDAIRAFDRSLATHPDLDAVFLPLGDGVAFAIRRS